MVLGGNEGETRTASATDTKHPRPGMDHGKAFSDERAAYEAAYGEGIRARLEKGVTNKRTGRTVRR